MIGRRWPTRGRRGLRRPGAAQGDAPALEAVRDPAEGWRACLPDPIGARVWAGVFADDLCRECTRAFSRLGDPGSDLLVLPISVPFDENGVVVLSSAPPKPDAPRVPAELELLRPPADRPAHYRFGLALARRDRQPLLVPGIRTPGTSEPLPLTLLTFAVGDRGMAVGGYGTDGRVVALELDETTARALAVALLITIGVKLTKAGYPR